MLPRTRQYKNCRSGKPAINNKHCGFNHGEPDQFAQPNGHTVRFSAGALAAFLAYATSPAAKRPGNFRDLSANIIRMTTLSRGGRIAVPEVTREFAHLSVVGTSRSSDSSIDILADIPNLNLAAIDLFDLVQFAQVCKVCRESASLSEAGRTLFAACSPKKTRDDADLLRKYLARFDLALKQIHR